MAMTSPSSQWSGSTSSIISQPVQTEEERLWRYLPLYKLALDGNWKLAKPFFLSDSDAIRAKITAAGDTALHVAAGTGKAIHFLEELLKLANVSDLRLLNGNGDTALSVAAMVGNTPAAKLFLKRDPQLALIVNNDGRLPITEAARFGHKKMVLLLLRFIEDGMMEPSGDKPGYSLLNLLIMAGFYDVVLVLAKHYRELITTGFVDGESLLNLIAQRPSAFPSGSRLSLRQRLIYAVVPVNLGNKLKSISSLLDGKHKNVDKLKPISLLHALLDKLQYLHQNLLHFGATLQVQRELQWFKEVEKFVHPTLKEETNFEGKTPAMVFTDAHKDLIKEGEKWMKDAANSCTVASALIATVAFAATITVPGGNDQNHGFPIFSEEMAFRVFAVSNAISLVSSTASVITFLSILTSRYAEGDFLVVLPSRLFMGLVTLFLSITSLISAFAATIYLIFGHKNDLIFTVVILVAFLPLWMFGSGHFPLFVDMFLSIVGRRIFHKQSARILH